MDHITPKPLPLEAMLHSMFNKSHIYTQSEVIAPSPAFDWWKGISLGVRIPVWDITLLRLKSMPKLIEVNGVTSKIPTLPNGDIPFHFKLELAYHLFSKSIK